MKTQSRPTMYMPNDPMMQNAFFLSLLTFTQESLLFIHGVALSHLDRKAVGFVEGGTYGLQTNSLFSLMNRDLPAHRLLAFASI